MKIFRKIKSLFRKKEDTVKIEKITTGDALSSRKGIGNDMSKLMPEGKIQYVTETSLCRTSYGMGKVMEDGNRRFLVFSKKIEVRYIPFVENDCIEAVYTINPEAFFQDKKGRYVYEITDSAQFFMLSNEQKKEIVADLTSRKIPYKFPEEIDNYNSVMNILKDSVLLMKNQDSNWFDKEKFLSEISEIKGSRSYKELHLIRLKDGRRFILIINQIIPNVIEYSPSFMNIYEPGAVKVSYQDGYAFIAPFGKPKQ